LPAFEPEVNPPDGWGSRLQHRAQPSGRNKGANTYSGDAVHLVNRNPLYKPSGFVYNLSK
jgi:hypothetical protein